MIDDKQAGGGGGGRGHYDRSGANAGTLLAEPTGSCRARFSGNISH